MADDQADFLPVDWVDNDRMNFMFSAFPESREVNPKHWDSKLHFWSKLILDSCRVKYNDNVCIDLATLQRRFSRNGLTPLGLNTVINEMLNQGTLQRKEDFMNCGSEGWMAWSYGLAKKSFWWSVRTVVGGDGVDGSRNGQFVLVDFAKEKANWVLAQHYKTVDNETLDNVIPWNVLKMRCSREDQEFDDDTLELLLCVLQRQGKAAVFTTPEGEKIVKFAKKSDQNVDPVSKNDVEMVRVRKTMASLTLRARKLTNEIESCRLKALEFSNQGSRSTALKLLKKKHQRQRALDETLGSLNSFEEILQRIQSGKTNQMVVDALKSATAALKGAHEGISQENVDDVMDDLNETMNMSVDIQSAIIEGNKRVAETAGIEDEELEDLERELESLAFEDQDTISAMQPTTPPRNNTPTRLPSLSPSAGHQSYSPPSQIPRQVAMQHSSSDLLSQLPDIPKDSPTKARDPRTRDLSRQVLLDS